MKPFIKFKIPLLLILFVNLNLSEKAHAGLDNPAATTESTLSGTSILLGITTFIVVNQSDINAFVKFPLMFGALATVFLGPFVTAEYIGEPGFDTRIKSVFWGNINPEELEVARAELESQIMVIQYSPSLLKNLDAKLIIKAFEAKHLNSKQKSVLFSKLALEVIEDIDIAESILDSPKYLEKFLGEYDTEANRRIFRNLALVFYD